jgi:hypothetical protein
VIDPVDYHGTLRRQLQPEAMKDFGERMADLDRQLGGAVAARP